MVKKKIKFIAAATAMLMSVGGMSACGLSSSDNDKGQVYYLNSKPEVVDQFQELADEYTKETGIQVNVQTATSDNYESTLTFRTRQVQCSNHVQRIRLPKLRQGQTVS